MLGMKSYAVLFAAATIGVATWACGQPSPSGPAACLQAESLDQLTTALDAAISGPADRDRTCLRQLIAPGARFTPVLKSADGSATARNLTIEDWISFAARRGSETIYERQIKTERQQYGNVAQLWCEYVTSSTPEGKPTSHGFNGFQAVYDGSHWTIVAVIWQAEDLAGNGPVVKP